MATRFGTFEELTENLPEKQKTMIECLKEIVLEIHPETTEVVRLGDNAATYGVGPKKMSEAYCYLMPMQKGHINLGFFYGAKLDDPANLLEGTGKNMRHVKVYDLEQANSERVRQLLVTSLNERRETLGR